MAACESKFVKIPVLGDKNVGKTLLMNRYVNFVLKYNTKSTSVGDDSSSKEVMIHNNTIATLPTWDTASQDRFDSLCLSLIRGADCCVLLYDVTDAKSFESLDYWRDKFLAEAALKDPTNFPFVLIGNKVDLPNRKVSTKQAEEWCLSRNQCPYFETSAKNGMNVESAFQKIAEAVMKRKIENNDRFNDISIQIFPSGSEKNKRNRKEDKCQS